MKLITIESYPSMPWSFKLTVMENGKSRHLRDARDAGEAAAAALSSAMQSSNYRIIGPDSVMKHIPNEMRSK